MKKFFALLPLAIGASAVAMPASAHSYYPYPRGPQPGFDIRVNVGGPRWHGGYSTWHRRPRCRRVMVETWRGWVSRRVCPGVRPVWY